MVERGGLENRCGRKSTEGSNPSLSAIFFTNPLEQRVFSCLQFALKLTCLPVRRQSTFLQSAVPAIIVRAVALNHSRSAFS